MTSTALYRKFDLICENVSCIAEYHSFGATLRARTREYLVISWYLWWSALEISAPTHLILLMLRLSRLASFTRESQHTRTPSWNNDRRKVAVG